MSRLTALGHLVLAICCVTTAIAIADDIPQPVPTAVELSRQSVDVLVDQLHSEKFASREQAAGELIAFGPPVVSYLRAALPDVYDAEARDRIEQIITRLAQDELQLKIQNFYAGDDTVFRGWPEFATLLADSPRFRTLFIEVRQAHPYIIESLYGTDDESDAAITLKQSDALEKMVQRIRHRQTNMALMPSTVDTLAAFIPAAGESVVLMPGHQKELIELLSKRSATALFGDDEVSPAFERLVQAVVGKTETQHRGDALHVCMLHRMTGILPIAVATLIEDGHSVDAVTTAIGAITRFGDQTHLERLAKQLSDHRVVLDDLFVDGSAADVRVCDVAIAAITRLSNHQAIEVGLDPRTYHPLIGIDVNSMGYPIDKPTIRSDAVAKATGWVEQQKQK